MRKLMLSSALAVGLAVGVAAAQADNPSHPNHGHHHSGQSPTSSHRCGVVQRGFVVFGDNSSSTATLLNGVWTGPLTLSTVTRANHHAKEAGVTPLPFTPSQPFQLTNAKLTAGGVTDTAAPAGVGLDDVQTTDHVQLIGKIKYAKKGGHGSHACTEAVDGIEPGHYDSPTNATIRQVVVHRSTTP